MLLTDLMHFAKVRGTGGQTLAKQLPKWIFCIAFVGITLFVSWLGTGIWLTQDGAMAKEPLRLHSFDFPGESISIALTQLLTDTHLFSGDVAYSFALDQCKMGPRPTGSLQGWALGDYIIKQLQSYNWSVSVQEFTYEDVPVRNIIGSKGNGPLRHNDKRNCPGDRGNSHKSRSTEKKQRIYSGCH